MIAAQRRFAGPYSLDHTLKLRLPVFGDLRKASLAMSGSYAISQTNFGLNLTTYLSSMAK